LVGEPRHQILQRQVETGRQPAGDGVEFEGRQRPEVAWGKPQQEETGMDRLAPGKGTGLSRLTCCGA